MCPTRKVQNVMAAIQSTCWGAGLQPVGSKMRASSTHFCAPGRAWSLDHCRRTHFEDLGGDAGACLRRPSRHFRKSNISENPAVWLPVPCLPSNLILIMLDIVRKRWRAGICKDCSLQIQKAHMLCSLHTHLSCSAVSHCMRFRPCGLVPNACLDATFQICLRNRAHLCGQSGAACDSTAFHGLRHFCICRPAPAPAPARPTRYNL